MTDGELIAAVQQGDADAWRVLYQRWLPWVWRYAYSLVQDRHAAEDVTSEAMTAWVQQLGKTGADAPQLAGWLRKVIHNKAVDYHRQGQRCRKMINEAPFYRAESNGSKDPSQMLETTEMQHQVRQALNLLSDTQRLVLEWKYAEDLCVREIAERLGVTEKAVEANLYRARQELRHHYQRLDAGQLRKKVSEDSDDGHPLLPRSGAEV